MAGYSIFVTYIFGTSSVSGSTSKPYQAGITYGLSSAIHCNYIQKIETDSITNKSVSLIMPNSDAFPFLRDATQLSSGDGSGWNANKLYLLAQIVSSTGNTAAPNPANWSIVDVTNQLDDYSFFSGSTIPPSCFDSDTIINVTVTKIQNAPKYNLSYLDYPSALNIDNDKLAFGEEVFFFGNVSGEIKAIAYTSDISMVLPLNQYNSTTNPTWDGLSPVQISEAGLFDDNNNLIAVGKFNYPIAKDSTVFRTVQFSLDF
jgi:hypothetical protein